MRKAVLDRTTKETSIKLRLTIEGKGRYKISTGIRFFDHMLELLAHHGGFDLELRATGDLDVDQHHTWKTSASRSGRRSRKRWETKKESCAQDIS